MTAHASRITHHAPLKLAIVGRPNVGKSSIINALTHSERVVVSPIPGTTRDAVDVPFEVETEGVRQAYVLIDTAGLRKTRRVDDSIEFFSVKRAEESIARCDIAILVLDAEAGITEQDKKVADRIVEARRACIVVVNKWDLIDDAVRKARDRGDRAPPKEGEPAGAQRHDDAVRVRRVGAEAPVLPRLRAGDLHLGQIRLPSGSPARGCALRGRPVAAKSPDRHSEPHAARLPSSVASRSARVANV